MGSWEVLAVELVTIVPQVLLCAWIFCRLLPLRRPAWFTVLYTVLLTSVHLLLSRVFPMPVWVKPLLQIVLAMALPCLFTRGSRLVSICLTLIQCTLMTLMEVLMVVITRWGTTETGMSYFYSVPAANLLMMRTGYNVLYGMFLVPVYLLWKRRFNSGMDYAAPELLPFLLGQAAMTVLVCAMLLTDTGQSAALYFTTVAAVLLSMLAMGVVVWAYFGNQEWHRLERRRLETAHQADLQRRRQAADNTSAEVETLRQELRSRLETAMGQLERRETAGARAQVLDAVEVLQASRKARYCDHPVADAVLWEQARRCEEAGIRLELHASIPDDVGLSGAAICSLFSNVLDNAVHACLALPTRQRWIRCTAVCRGAYLVLREENPRDPAAPDHEGPSSGQGLGLRILSELARRCDGSVEVQRDDGRFRITVCLRRQLPGDGEEAEP